MAVKLLLDTNAYSSLGKGDQKIKRLLEEADFVYLSIVVMAELYAGFKLGNREASNREYLSAFSKRANLEIIPVSIETADIYAEIFSELKNKGKPIPTNDIWIAAQAIETGSKLLTYDLHFSHISGLRLGL